ncbi:hypothetical protein J3458_014386 [Metarhizium acridum]|uniref:uncharacterized protein n=1 Tax=Metarhizium acridum TaxID=92637 RepID=UPI001C6C33D4|nr:hypothetical protein J3458_014386 [Metarhizium acridum]
MAPLNDYDVTQSNSRPIEGPGREFLAQWSNPAGIFTILLIIGGDVIQLACSAVTGGPRFPPTPLAFSFGWVSYIVAALRSPISDIPLLSSPEIDIKVINLDSGYGRQNPSWVLSRLVKAYGSWMPEEVRGNIPPPKTTSGADSAPIVSRRGGLCVAVYRWRKKSLPGVPIRDIYWWSGYGVTALQLIIAAIPILLYGNWAIFLATAAGSLFAYVFLAMPQWREEKWGIQHAKKTKAIALTRGNGSQHVIIIKGQVDDPNALTSRR